MPRRGPDPYAPPPFWNKSLTISEQFTLGLRSAFVASYYAAPLLIAADGALVVNVSYYGAVSYHLDPAYGATKAGLDKLRFDMAQDFKLYNIAVVSIWPGPTATERAKSVPAKIPGGVKILESAEAPKFSGLAIASLYSDQKLMSKSGSVVIAAEAALEYGFKDFNGKQPPSIENRRALRTRSSRIRVDFTTPRSAFPDGITKPCCTSCGRRPGESNSMTVACDKRNLCSCFPCITLTGPQPSVHLI